mmetsp:Transcript_58729/g.124700  ORF Transcript_58729/g.124700 Transcript_58729/m.124700 type:complete len:445 (+) Transcript_58729:753-2087(+)
MDVTLLSETEIGKRASKVVKSMKKMSKGTFADKSELEDSLHGHPRFWKKVSWWDEETHRMRNNQYDKDVQLSPYQFLQRMLQDWKDMACDEGVEASSPPPAKKRRPDDNERAPIATCGKEKRFSASQHRTDMRLLHASPDWRSLHASLRKRAEIMRKSHGDKIRGIRENLEKDRAKVGKVVLKRAVGRVRGNSNCELSSARSAARSGSKSGPAVKTPGGSSKTAVKSSARTERREAILSGSRGNKARMQQLVRSASSSSSVPRSGGGGSKMSQLRQETKVASSWRSTGLARKPSASVASSGFGASVARAGGKGNSRKPQASLLLKGGKKIQLPSAMGGLGKTVGVGGVFSTLQKKKEAEEKKRQQLKDQRRRREGRVGGAANNGKMQQLRKSSGAYGRMMQRPPRESPRREPQRGNGRDGGRMQQREAYRRGSGDDGTGGGRYR